MFKKILKWLGILLAGIAVLILVGLLALYVLSEEKLDTVYQVPASDVTVTVDAESIARGEHLVDAIGLCKECHGPDLSGTVVDEGWLTVLLANPNLTTGKGGIGGKFTDEDWARAIRHGVKPDGTSVIGMPAELVNHLSDEDTAAIIAYLKSVPPVDNELPKTRLGPMARYMVLQMPFLLAAQVIDHDAPRPPAPAPGVSAAYGEYISVQCKMCHGENLAGSSDPGSGPNITPGGDPGNWTEADFINTIRTGTTPEGNSLDPEMMPWKLISKLTDDELRAIWLYLQSVPAVETPLPSPTP